MRVWQVECDPVSGSGRLVLSPTMVLSVLDHSGCFLRRDRGDAQGGREVVATANSVSLASVSRLQTGIVCS